VTGRRWIVVAIGIASGAAAIAQQPARDAAAVATGTGSISGVVYVNGDPKQPARRVRVTLGNLARSSPGQTTTSDDKGAFTFRGLAAGRFELQAFKPGYLRASYGAARPERPGTPVVLEDGEAVSGLAMTIVRGGVITGVVRDLRGRPAPGVNVRVLKLGYNNLTGERTLEVPAGSSVAPTDDRGEYRAYGLPPGGYVVLVPPPLAGRDDPNIRQLTSAQVQQALRAARSTSAATPGATTAPVVTSPPARLNYAPIFHPGVTDIGAAVTIPLALGEERAGVDVTVQLVPTATVSGTVTSPSGPIPPGLTVGLVPVGPQTEMLAGAGVRGVSASLNADGAFRFNGVAPGAYTAKVTVGRGGRGGDPYQMSQWAAADVQVAGEDVSVALTLQPGVPIAGRVVFEGATPPTPEELKALSFRLAPYGAGGEVRSPGGGNVDAEGRFAFPSVAPDTYRWVFTWNAASARDKWTLKSSTANGRDAFEAPLRVSAGEPLEWTVTYTDTPATLAGTFQDPGGRAATEYYILVFSTDRRQWTPGSRRVRTTRPGTDGAFVVKELPPGDYYLAALPDLETGEWNDPALLESLVKSSATVTLREGQTTTQNYQIR
jgi:hypothetical protein